MASVYDRRFRDCRIFGHRWEPTTVKLLPRERMAEQSMKCSRCKAGKKFTVNRDGQQVRSSYQYDPEYLLPGQRPHDVRAEMRRGFYGI